MAITIKVHYMLMDESYPVYHTYEADDLADAVAFADKTRANGHKVIQTEICDDEKKS